MKSLKILSIITLVVAAICLLVAGTSYDVETLTGWLFIMLSIATAQSIVAIVIVGRLK